MELIVELLLWFFIELFAELFLEFGLGSLGHALRPRRQARPALAYLGLAGLGLLVGLGLALILPHRLLPRLPVPGLSLLLSPLLAGAVMRSFGRWRRRRGRPATLLATFWGGATFALAAALVRLLLVSFG